jgi:hypothetical protein
MKLTRMICILAGALAVMLTVVVLRAESTRLHFERARLDARAAGLWQQLREYEIELARLRNPEETRERIRNMRAVDAAAARGAVVQTARP